MSNLKKLHLSNNSLALIFTKNWVPPFQLPTIELRSCKLGPTFPKWLQTQNKFSNIDISNAAISDTVPEWFWAKLPRQKVMKMNISYNNLRGILPKFPPTYIPTSMSFGSNQFEGSIPLFLRNSGRLDLSKNKLSKKLNSLVYLDLSHNNFSGKIPTSMGSLLHLQVLFFRNNSLVEGIPFSMRNCRKLVMICCLRNIQLLDLSVNNLSGKIPKSIKNPTSMAQTTSSIYHGDHWYFFKNSIYASNMSYDLNALLTWKGSEQILISLNLSRNNLTEEIPSNIGNLAFLDSLDLSRNQFVDSIPLSVTQIHRLGVLDLSHNHLTRKISTATQLQGFNPSSYEDNFNLCGPPLQKMCIEGRSTHEPNVEIHEDEYSLLNNDFFISMTFRFVLSFWKVFSTILFKSSWRHAYFNFLNNVKDNIYVKE
uniref:Leucine-rich repeat-containing N-terminal plant-type domain-containing protein n=1 Tax=Phaseolus vulgaris TaxID=3885 RepID=V7C1U7_PHAVU|nr:hypothetical protein PHAVU_004G105500g [Phaseolus vulgaris]ESW24132.1 hypothetical protein PHAVU_004G105500g [Phaseolus vulgaris]